MEAALSGGTLCAPARLHWHHNSHLKQQQQQQPEKVEQVLQSQATRQQPLPQQQEERKKQQCRQQWKQQGNAEPKQQQQQRARGKTRTATTADEEQQEATQQQEKAAAADQSACLATFCLAELNVLRCSYLHASRQTTPRDRRRHAFVVCISAAAEEPPAASTSPVETAAAIAPAASSPRPSGAGAFADPRASPAALLLPTAVAVGCPGPTPPPAVAGVSAATAAAASAAGDPAGRAATASHRSAWTVQCSTAFTARSKESFSASCCGPVARFLRLSLLLLLGPLLLCSSMMATAVSLRTREKPVRRTLLRPRPQTAGSAVPRLLCTNCRVSLTRLPAFACPAAADIAAGSAAADARSPAASAPSRAASGPARPPMHLRHTVPTAAAPQATPPTADPAFSAASVSSLAAAVHRNLSAVRGGEDTDRLTIPAAAASTAHRSSVRTEAAAATRLRAAVPFAASSSSQATPSLKHLHSASLRVKLQPQRRTAATTTPLLPAAFRRRLSVCPAAVGVSPAGAAVPSAATLSRVAAAACVSCSAMSKAAPTPKSATAGPPLFISRHTYPVAFNAHLRAGAASPSAARPHGQRAVLTAATPTTTVTSVEAPPTGTRQKSTGRLAKTAAAAAGALRAAEYGGSGAGARPRYWESSLNRVTLMGRVGAEPEIRQMTNGDKFAAFSMATSSHWVDKTTGEMQARTEWHRVVVYDESLVDLVDKYLQRAGVA